jgi:Flp pilus assembly protein TadD
VFEIALNEFETSMEYSADFAFGRFNLGNLYAALNRPEDAIRNYQAAIRIDELSYPPKVNLAMLYYQRKENDKAGVLLREVTEAHPEVYDAAYSLGLLLGEMEQYDEAAVYLERAAKGLPERDRIHYNLGLILDYLKQDAKAEAALQRAVELAPDNLDYLYVLANYYMKRGQLEKAEGVARQMVEKHPSSPIGHDFLKALQR